MSERLNDRFTRTDLVKSLSICKEFPADPAGPIFPDAVLQTGGTHRIPLNKIVLSGPAILLLPLIRLVRLLFLAVHIHQAGPLNGDELPVLIEISERDRDRSHARPLSEHNAVRIHRSDAVVIRSEPDVL